MKSHSKRILSLVFALLMAFQQVMFAAQTVDLLTPAEQTQTVDLLTGEEENKTVDLLTPAEPSAPIEQPIEQSKPIIEENKVNENQTVDLLTPGDDIVVPEEGKKSTTTILIGGEEEEETQDDSWDLTPAEITVPEENHDEEEKKDATFEDEEHHENAGVLPWSTDLVKPWSIYREPKKVYRPGEDLDLTELLVEIKTGRSGSLYNIEDLINDEFTTITRTRKSDGEKVRLDDKIYEDETMTIHMDGCQDLTIDFTVDENLKDEEEALEAFQDNLIREEFRDGLDFSLYLIKKGERENPIVAYSLDPHKLTPLGNGVDKKLKDGPLFDLKDINTWDRFDIETIGKVKAILERSAEIKNTENLRKKLITQLAIWNVTSNIIPREIDATVSEIEENETTELGPELKPTDEEKAPEEKEEEEPIEIIDQTTPEEEIESVEQDDEVEAVEEQTEIEEPAEEKTEAEETVEENTQKNKESEKIEEQAPVQSTVHKIVFDVREIDVPYNEVELSDEEYALYNELTSLEAIELKSEDEDLKIYEPIIEETENPYADLVTIGESDIDSIERVETEVTFDAVDYSFQNLYHTLETSSMLGFGQPRDFNVLLKATMKASRKIVEGDKFEVEILSKTLPILNGEEGRANDIQIDGKVVATAEYIAEEHKIVYTFVEDLDTDKVEIEQEFKQIKEEKAALLNMLDVSENLVLDAVRGAEGDEDSEENPDGLEISPEFEENLIELKLGNTPVQYNGVSFETKKFRLKTTMTAKAYPIWQIPVGWTFDVNIGPYLKPDYKNYPLKDLYNPDKPKEVIAEPKYNEATHTITYTYVKSLSSTKTLDIDQYLAFDMDNIRDKDKIDINISVEPKDNPKQQMPTKTVYRDDRSSVITSAFEVEFDENGEPNLNNQYKFFEYGENYRVTFDAKSTPVVVDRKMTAIDWEITFDGNGRKLGEEDLKLITNFTAVENSGIENIDNVKLNGQPVTNLESNFSNGFLINDSKNVVGKQSADKYVFTFTTKVNKQQQAYVLDISAKLKGINKTGAVRLIQPYIDGVDLDYESPTILKYSNRVTNKGEFLSEDQIRWTLTEEVSSGDDGILPLVTRALSDNQTIASFKVAYYILNGDGKMAMVGEPKNITSKEIEQGKLDGDKKFAPGTIAVYEIITKIDSKDDNQGNVYSFGDNRISLYRNVDVNIKWSVQEAGKDNLPEETLTMKSEDGKHTTSKTIKPEENEKINPAGKNVQIENVKRWEFVNGELKEIKYNLTQKLPNDEEVNDGTIYYKELTNSFNIYDKRYEILNTIFKGKDVKIVNIKIIKKDSKNESILLPGARFSLIGDGSSNMEYSGVTDFNGEVIFKNVTPGVYILQEDSAPDGYKRHNLTDTVTVDENGRVTWTNNIIATENYKTSLENKNGKLSTDVLYRNGSPVVYPSFMNALSYATIDGKDFKYYVFLKPDYNTTGTAGSQNGTDQITRLFISYSNVARNSKTPKNIDIYSVPATNKSNIKNDFLNKDIEKHLSEFKIVNKTDRLTDKNIEFHTNAEELYLGKHGYQIDFPTQRFEQDAGIIICYSGQIDDEQIETLFCYDWIQLNNKSSNDRILDARTTIPGLNDRVINSNNEASNPILVVNNTAKKRFPIIVNTRDDKRKIVGGAEFTLTEKNTNRTVEVQTTDSNGRCEFRDIPEGEYLLKETQSPTGLSKYNLIFHVTVTPGGQILYTAYDENGNEVDPGEKYTIGTVEVDDDNPGVGTKSIKVLSHSMTLNETSGWGTRRGVWEEAKYEAYDFKASFMLNNTNPGDKIEIDFDDNWNMTQWSGEMPNIVTKDGQIVATPYLDTTKNVLTYTLTEYVRGKTNINASLLIQSIRPSKYYVKVDKKDDGSPIIYKFLDTITTLPGAAEQSKVEQITYVEPDLGPYFGIVGDRDPLYITQNVDITTKDSGDLELRNVTVFNPEGKVNVAGDRQLKIFYGMTTDPNVTEMGNKIQPPYIPTRVVVYKVAKPNKYNLPVTGGIKPSKDTDTYEQIADFDIVYNRAKVETKNGVTLNYNENRVNISRNIVPTLNNNTNVQFMITLPPTSNGEGYVVEQFYDVTDADTFRDNYSMTSVYYTGAWGRSGGISQMKPKKNSGTANSGEVVDVPEINHDLTVYHYKSIGNFIVKKTDENGEPLEGAKFTLIDGKGTVVDEVTVGEDGIGKFNNIPSGKYTLKETKAPDGYKATDRTVEITVGDGGKISFGGIEKEDKVFKVGNTVVERKLKTTYEKPDVNSDVWQDLTIHKPWVRFMNIKSKILSSDNNKVKTRIYLNSSMDPDRANGPDKVTVFKIEEALNTNGAIKTNVYKVPKEAKGNIDEYLETNKITPSKDEATIVSNTEIEFSSLGDPARWNGAAYVIDVEASYKAPNPDLGESITQDRYIKYKWYCKPEPFTFIEGKVGTQLKVSKNEVDPSTPTGDGVESIIESDTLTLQVINQKSKTKVTITKVDEKVNDGGSRKVLPGAVFGLFDENDKAITKDGENYEVETNKDGKATFDDLEPGTYIIKEIKAPNGYELTNKTWTVVVGEDNKVAVTEKETYLEYSIENPKNTIDYQDYNGNPVLKIASSIKDNGDGTFKGILNIESLYDWDDEIIKSMVFELDNDHFQYIYNGSSSSFSVDKINWDDGYPAYKTNGVNEFTFEIIPNKDIVAGEYIPITNVKINGHSKDINLPKLKLTTKEIVTDKPNKSKENKDNEFSFQVDNKYKGYEVEFKKVDETSTDSAKHKYLEGAEFKIEIKDGDKFRPLNDEEKKLGANDTSTSDANGTISFKGLKPGTYRLIETKAPDHYHKIDGAAKVFYINPDGKAFIIESDDREVPLNAEYNKIKNTRKGTESFTVNKQGDDTKPLAGVEFTLYSFDGTKIKSDITDKEGKVVFEELDYGTYILKETKTVDGYILDSTPKIINIGKDFEVPAKDPNKPDTSNNVSNAFILDKNKSKQLRASEIRNNRYDVVYPNSSESIFAELNYKVDPNVEIKPGDTFTMTFSEDVDLDGIDKTPDNEFDIYGPFGKFAKAEVQGYYPNRREIKYTVTNYVENNSIDSINILYPLYVNRFKYKTDGSGNNSVKVKAKLGNIEYSDDIDVVFSNIFDLDKTGQNIMAYMRELHVDTKKFKSVVYVNPNGRPRYDKRIFFNSNQKYNIDSVKIYKVKDEVRDKTKAFPHSFGIDFGNLGESGLEYYGEVTGNKNDFIINDTETLTKEGKFKYGSNAMYVLEVDGTVDTKKLTDFRLGYNYYEYYQHDDGHTERRWYNIFEYEDVWVPKWVKYYDQSHRETFGQFYYPDSTTEGIRKITLKNYKNKIEYTKVDGTISGTAVDTKPQGATEGLNEPIETPRPMFSSEGKALKGAEFKLKKAGVFDDKSLRVSGEDGKFSWEGLAPGYYEVWETKAPDGYPTPKEKVSHFTVNEKGEIVGIKDNMKIIINEKIKPNIEFQKVDGSNKEKTVVLPGAEFTLYKAKKDTNGEYEKVDGALQFGMVDNKFNILPDVDDKGKQIPEDKKNGYKVTSDADGKFKFEKLEDGIYAVKETKAPKDYALLTKYAFFFKVEGGKIYRVNELGKYIDSNKKDVNDEKKDTDSLIVDMEKDKAQENPIEIENFKAEYPSTGGVGALPFVFIGMMIMMVGAYMFIRRRDALYE